MNIGVVVDNDLIDDKRVLREIDILRETGYEVFVLCFGFTNKTYTSVEGVSITRIRISKKLKNILFFFLNFIPVYEYIWASSIKKFIKANNLQVLHVHDLYMAKAGWNGINNSGRTIPMILDLHENYPYAVTTYNWTKGRLRSLFSQPLKWQKKEREYLGFADRIIVLSDDFRDTLTERYPELPKALFTALPNVPNLAQAEHKIAVKPVVNFESKGPVLFYFGVVAERRGIFDALSVFEELVSENHPLVFLIIGPVDKKDSRRFFNIINSEQLHDRVNYIPWIDGSELPAYLEITDICLAPFQKNPQHESGVANKIYDYMLGKKPVIASDCKPQKKLIERYRCGLIYTTRSEFKAAIEKLSSDPELRSEMGKNGFNAIVNENHMGLIKGRLINLYKTISTSQVTGIGSEGEVPG